MRRPVHFLLIRHFILPCSYEIKKMALLSPAKINLCLAVTGKRPDGYHELLTLFCRIGLYDHIRLALQPRGISVSCSHPEVPTDHTNIAHTAASVFFSKILQQTDLAVQGIHIEIEKNIPVGAGLGGGSSNAASVLMGLNDLYNTPFSEKALMAMGLEIGADVPFFIFKKPAIGQGIGEKLTVYNGLSPYKVILVNPGIYISTKEVYKNLNLGLTKCEQKLNCLLFEKDTFTVPQHMCNDLEMVTESLCKDIPMIKDKLRTYGAEGALMSGSGPTVFGLFQDADKAQNAYEQCLGNKNWTVFMTDLLI